MLHRKIFRRVGTVGKLGVVGYSVRQRRVWQDDSGGEDSGQQSGDADGGEDSGGGDKIEDPVAYAKALEKRLNERDAELNRWKDQAKSLTDRVSAMEAANKKRLEQSGNHEELLKQTEAELEQLKPVAERATALEKVIRESNQARIERIPETMRGLVPTDYAPEKLQAWLNANEAALTKPPAPNYDAGAGSGSGGNGVKPKLSADEREVISAFDIDPDTFAKIKQELTSEE